MEKFILYSKFEEMTTLLELGETKYHNCNR